MKSSEEGALWAAMMMLLTVVAIVGMVCGYKHCEQSDERIRSCLHDGHLTAAECHDAYQRGPL